MHGRMEYNTDLYDETTIRRMLGHYERLLEEVIINPSLPVSRISLLTPQEERQLLIEWNDTAVDYPKEKCVHELVEEQTARTPHRVAVVFEEQSVKYIDLNQRSNQLAHHLRAIGVGPDVLVAVCLDRSPDMLVAILGVLKAGGAYLPVDPALPKDRQAFMLEDAQVPILLTTSTHSGEMPPHTAIEIHFDTDWDSIATHSIENPARLSNSKHLAYVLYTSGSTGKPKGVTITHSNLVNFLASMRLEPGLNHNDTLVAVTTLSFDIAGLELWLPLYVGARVVIASREVAMDGIKLAALLDSSDATMMQATPATWRLLLETGWAGKTDLVALCGGEALSSSLVTSMLPLCKSLWNMYGPTETTIWSTLSQVQAHDGVSLGHPIANTQILIVDSHQQLVPVGVAGELCIGGDGLSRGYLNRPELTAERFIPNPFSQQADERLYKTGDLARRLADGRIEYLGRSDHQVKIRGFRIELGEIEAVLMRHPFIREGVVVAREDVEGDKRLVGYVVLAPDARFDPADLRLWIKESLPEYMVPVAWVQMDRLPLSPAGKVDRKNLPTPEYVRPELSSTFQQARTPTEELVASIYAEVLQLDKVGLHDDFFELGGHSLLGTQVVSRIRHAFQIELPLRSLFEAPNVAGLAERVETAQRQMQGLQTSPLRRIPRNQPLPLSLPSGGSGSWISSSPTIRCITSPTSSG